MRESSRRPGTPRRSGSTSGSPPPWRSGSHSSSTARPSSLSSTFVQRGVTKDSKRAETGEVGAHGTSLPSVVINDDDMKGRENSLEKKRKAGETGNQVIGDERRSQGVPPEMEGRLAMLEARMAELSQVPQQMQYVSDSVAGLASMVQSMQVFQQQLMQASVMPSPSQAPLALAPGGSDVANENGEDAQMQK